MRWTTLGQDAVWKRRMLARLPRGRADVLDYACGTGLLTLAAARRCAPGRIVGLDLSADMLAQARAKGSLEWVHGDAETWVPPRAAFDAVLAAYLPKYVDPQRWLAHAARALRPGGLLLAYDFTYPRGAIARHGWEAWWRLMGPRLARNPAWSEVVQELPGLVRATRWVEAMGEALPRHGFDALRMERWCLGAATLVEARRTSVP